MAAYHDGICIEHLTLGLMVFLLLVLDETYAWSETALTPVISVRLRIKIALAKLDI